MHRLIALTLAFGAVATPAAAQTLPVILACTAPGQSALYRIGETTWESWDHANHRWSHTNNGECGTSNETWSYRCIVTPTAFERQQSDGYVYYIRIERTTGVWTEGVHGRGPPRLTGTCEPGAEPRPPATRF